MDMTPNNLNNPGKQGITPTAIGASEDYDASGFGLECPRASQELAQLGMSVKDMVKEASDILPQQAILENFVHHNPWEMLQHVTFQRAHELLHELLSYASPGERTMTLCGGSDPRLRANSTLAELSAIFLDRGAAKASAPNRERGFLWFFATLEKEADFGLIGSWRAHSRQVADRILQELNQGQDPEQLAETLLAENLQAYGVEARDYVLTTRSMLWDMQGYAGMVKRMEMHPGKVHPFCLL